VYSGSIDDMPCKNVALAAIVAASLVACSSGLKLGLLRSSARRPSNVAVYFTVDTSDNHPVPGLTADKFVIYEDGGKVSEFESKQTILNPQVAASHYTLLLIDMSGSVVESKHVDEVVTAASAFTQRVEKYQKVGVYAFDGSTDLYPIVPFTESTASATGGVERLKTFTPRDPSTNLHGAVVEALKTLRKSLAADPRPLKFGTLVVFTDGTDRANRVSKDDLDKALDAPENKSLDVFAIGVGAEMNNSHLEDIGRSGTVKETDQANLGKAFDDIASRVEGMTQRYYLFSYCSTRARGGARGEHRSPLRESEWILALQVHRRWLRPQLRPEHTAQFRYRPPARGRGRGRQRKGPQGEGARSGSSAPEGNRLRRRDGHHPAHVGSRDAFRAAAPLNSTRRSFRLRATPSSPR
jgi:hypothetical protein